MKQIKVIKQKALLKCLMCGNETESEAHANTDLGNPVRIRCNGECNNFNNHRVIAKILTYEELPDTVDPEPPAPVIIVDESVELNTEPEGKDEE